MTKQILKGKKVDIIIKKDFEIGKEAEIADEIMDFALQGYATFASHLKNPKIFWKDILFAIKQTINDLSNEN